MPECKRDQIYHVIRIEARGGGHLVETAEGAVFGTLEAPPLKAGDRVALGATCAGWTQLMCNHERLKAKVFKEPVQEPEVAASQAG